jgi:hypothetical protein
MQLQKDIDALRVAARLLADDDSASFAKAAPSLALDRRSALRGRRHRVRTAIPATLLCGMLLSRNSHNRQHRLERAERSRGP